MIGRKFFSPQKQTSQSLLSISKGKAVPLQAWSGPEGSRKLRFPDFMTTAQDGGRVSALRTGRLYPQEGSWYSFLLEAESTPGP
jgi:hypothetical protein